METIKNAGIIQKVGNCNYTVNFVKAECAKETLEEKMRKIIEREALSDDFNATADNFINE